MLYNSFFYRCIRYIWWYVCRLLPISKNKIVFSSYYGKGYSDNLKYIAEEFIGDSQFKFKLIWCCKGKPEADTLPKEIIPTYVGSLDWVYQLSTAQVWIDNCRKSFKFKKKKQLYIQTYHGCGAGKKCERDVQDKLSKVYVRMSIKDGQYTDLMISPDRFMTQLYHKAFWYDGPVYEIGFPRIDLLLNEKSRDVMYRKVSTFFKIQSGKHIVLYAPTFRADWSFSAYCLDFYRVLSACRKRFCNDYVMLVHLHPNVATRFSELKYDSNVINATIYPDMQELMAAADILIGDYSSVNHEFSIMKKPVFMFAVDLDEYRKDRDFNLPIDEYPFPLATNNDELVDLILKFDNNVYLDKLAEYHKKLGVVFNEHSALDCASLIKDYFALGCDKNVFLKKHMNEFM